MNKKKDCIFCKIAGKEIDTELVYDDDQVVVFPDINPQAPVHYLVVPKKHIKNLNLAEEKILGHCMEITKSIARKMKIEEKGYRIVVNCNEQGGQEVEHLHFHVLGGRQMRWPPG
ncbi:MAG: histidine triad nucleotide-binding protein [Elusimicrobiota bacterium]